MANHSFIYVYKSEGCKYCDLFDQSETKQLFFENNTFISDLDCSDEISKMFAKDIHKVKTVPALIIFPNPNNVQEFVLIDDFSSLTYEQLQEKADTAVNTYLNK